MSWSDVFPILTDEHVDAFEAGVSEEERRLYDSWFAVKEVINHQPEAAHIVSTSLFWKNIRADMPDIVVKDRRMFMAPRKRNLLRFDPWQYYTVPLLKGAHWIGKRHPDAVLRVYLAADLEFLVPDLAAAGCEIHLMSSNSLAHNPGAMWRMLAFEERDKLVTMLDSERAGKPDSDLSRTVEAKRMGLGWWRVPVWGEENEIGAVGYRPMLGCQLGTNRSLPASLLMKALIWHTKHKTIETNCKRPGCTPTRVHGCIWPDYGFDEWFLQTAVYPRAVFDGILSFIPANVKSRLLPLDIEYVQWANANSEMVYFGSAGGECCNRLNKEAGPGDEEVEAGRLKNFQYRSILKKTKSVWVATENLTQRHPLPPLLKRLRLLGGRMARDEPEVIAWFNPGVAVFGERRWMAYRTECRPALQWSRVNLVELDEEWQPLPGTNRLLEVSTQFGEWGAEDPRLHVHQDRMFLSYTDGWKVGMAELTSSGRVLRSRIVNVPLDQKKRNPLGRKVRDGKFDGFAREKNWTFFSLEEKLYLIYWVQPSKIFEFDPVTWTFGREHKADQLLPGLHGEIHNASNSAAHDGLLWQLIHTKTFTGDYKWRYHCWIRAFDSVSPYRTRYLSKKPVLNGSREQGAPAPLCGHEVIFASALLREKGGWRIFFGENDRRIGMTFLPDSKLATQLRKLPG